MRTTTLFAILIAPCTLVGCHEFQSLVADGTCGNGIVEPIVGEACDLHVADPATACGAPRTPGACLFVCETAACPDGFRCGQDGVCRASAGTFGAPTFVEASARELFAADADGDGLDDVLAVDRDRMTVAYGAPDGALSTRTSLPIPRTEGRTMVADVDADGDADVVTRAEFGYQFFLGEPARRMVPAAVPSVRRLPLPTRARTFSVRAETGREPDLLVVARDGGAWSLDVFESTETAPAFPVDLGAGPLATHIAVGDLDAVPDAVDEIALAAKGGTTVLIVSTTCSNVAGCTFERRAELRTPSGWSVADGTHFGDVDGDLDLDLVVSLVRGDEEYAAAVALGAPGGQLGPLELVPGLLRAVTCVPCQFNALGVSGLEAVADIDGDGLADYVGREGVHLAGPGPTIRRTLSPFAQLDEAWGPSVTADLDRDGKAEAIALRDDAIDIAVLTDRVALNVISVALATQPRLLTTGDFDGDLLPDIAVVEAPGTVSVLFSGAQGVATQRVVMAELPDVSSMTTANIDADGIDDLVLTMPIDGEEQVILLNGESTRRMTSLLTEGINDAHAIGRFDAGAGPRMIIRLIDGWWVGAVDNAARARPVEARRVLSPEDCDVDRHDQLLMAAADLDGDGIQEALLHQAPEANITDARIPSEHGFRQLRFDGDTLTCPTRSTFTTAATPRSLHTADLDGDGHLDVVVGIDAQGDDGLLSVPPAGQSGFLVWWGDPETEGDLAAEPVFFASPGPAQDRFRIAPFQADGDATMELAFASGTDVGIIDFGPDRTPTPRPVTTAFGERVELVGADVDGDGLQDLVVSTGSALLVHRQRECAAAAEVRGDCVRR